MNGLRKRLSTETISVVAVGVAVVGVVMASWADSRANISELRNELRNEITGLRAGQDQLRIEFQTRLDSLRSEIMGEIRELRTAIQALDDRLRRVEIRLASHETRLQNLEALVEHRGTAENLGGTP